MNCEINRNSVLQELSHHIGKENGIKGKDLVVEILWETGTDADERKLREVVEELRLEGHHVCAHPANGYFIAANDEELNESCVFLYKRAMKSLTQISAMKKASLPDLRGQLGLKI